MASRIYGLSFAGCRGFGDTYLLFLGRIPAAILVEEAGAESMLSLMNGRCINQRSVVSKGLKLARQQPRLFVPDSSTALDRSHIDTLVPHLLPPHETLPTKAAVALSDPAIEVLAITNPQICISQPFFSALASYPSRLSVVPNRSRK